VPDDGLVLANINAKDRSKIYTAATITANRRKQHCDGREARRI